MVHLNMLVACIAVAALAPVAVVDSFVPQSSPLSQSRTMPSSSLFSPTMPISTSASSNILGASLAANGDGSVPNLADKVIQKLEKKEAQLDKKRVRAMEQLKTLEANISELQTKKQEYLNGSELAETPPGGIFSETTARSAVKAFLWRIIAGSVTFITSLRFSGSIATALSIVGSDFFSKSFTMFIGERIMNKSQAGRKSGADGAGRSLVKALIWRLFAICNTLTMAIFIAKDISIASKIAGSDAIFKTGLMFVYERVWAKVEWGKEYQMEFNI